MNGAVSGFTSGALTGGFGSALTGSTAGLSNPLLRYGADTASETAVDTLVDSATGGNVTPTSIATNLALNAVTEGVSVRGAKGAKADVNTNKPKAGDVPVTKSHKDMTPVQQLALPGPTSKPLALPAPKSTPKTDFYVKPNGDIIPATGYRYMNSIYAKETMENMSAPGSYFGFSRFDSAAKVRDAYQIAPEWSDVKMRGKFNTLPLIDDIYVPKGQGGEADYLEPLTKDFIEYGQGGYPQLKVDKIINFEEVVIIGD